MYTYSLFLSKSRPPSRCPQFLSATCNPGGVHCQIGHSPSVGAVHRCREPPGTASAVHIKRIKPISIQPLSTPIFLKPISIKLISVRFVTMKPISLIPISIQPFENQSILYQTCL